MIPNLNDVLQRALQLFDADEQIKDTDLLLKLYPYMINGSMEYVTIVKYEYDRVYAVFVGNEFRYSIKNPNFYFTSDMRFERLLLTPEEAEMKY